MSASDSAAVSAVTAAADAKVEVSARSRHLPELQGGEGVYYFAYQITIRNIGGVAFQLLSRRWEITDGNGRVREIEGEGVVGERPRLSPSFAFAYGSYVDLPTPAGSMSGTYQMKTADGAMFDAAIPRFSLQVPTEVH